MNEKRFIQLINFQIDGEISPPELAELEQEVATNPRRREIYQSYCRLQQASQLVYNQFGEALAETVDLKKYQILARDAGHRLQRGLFYSVAALAAACLSVVAAVAVFQDAGLGNPRRHAGSESGFTKVEVLQPSVLNNRTSFFRTAGVDLTPEPFSFFGSARSSIRGFQPPATPTVWEAQFHPSSGTAIRGRSAFESSELVSFQFQR